MTVWTNQLQIIQPVMISVPIFVMRLQYLPLCISTPLAFSVSFLQQSQFYNPLVFNLITRSADFVLNTGSIFISTSSTTCLLVGACKYWSPTNNARILFSASNAVTNRVAIGFPFISVDFNRPPINSLAANKTLYIWISLVLNHSSSIPELVLSVNCRLSTVHFRKDEIFRNRLRHQAHRHCGF